MSTFVGSFLLGDLVTAIIGVESILVPLNFQFLMWLYQFIFMIFLPIG